MDIIDNIGKFVCYNVNETYNEEIHSRFFAYDGPSGRL